MTPSRITKMTPRPLTSQRRVIFFMATAGRPPFGSEWEQGYGFHL